VIGVLTLWERRSPPPEPTPFPTPTIDAAAVLASAIPTATETLVPTATPYVYRVLPDDSLFAIALKLGVSLTDLMELNGLTETSVLDVGQVLLVPTPGARPAASATPPAGSAPTATEAVVEAPVVAIIGVTGVGQLADEAVQILNSGGVAAMAGWTLEDGQGAVFIFPEFTLHRGAVSVQTRAGENTVIDLFWGLDHPLWSSGTTITLRDAAGVVQSTFTIPTG
jgi:LysM repeat protein